MGAVSGAFAAAATTPLDVIKTHMMCTAASRPSMVSSSRVVWQVCMPPPPPPSPTPLHGKSALPEIVSRHLGVLHVKFAPSPP